MYFHYLGKKGEETACQWLIEKKFLIIHRNWRYSHLEVDIIASRQNILHFIEVKTRANKKFGEPEEGISKRKIKNLMLAAEAYQSEFPGYKRIQIDSLSIRSDTCFFIEDIYL